MGTHTPVFGGERCLKRHLLIGVSSPNTLKNPRVIKRRFLTGVSSPNTLLAIIYFKSAPRAIGAAVKKTLRGCSYKILRLFYCTLGGPQLIRVRLTHSWAVYTWHTNIYTYRGSWSSSLAPRDSKQTLSAEERHETPWI